MWVGNGTGVIGFFSFVYKLIYQSSAPSHHEITKSREESSIVEAEIETPYIEGSPACLGLLNTR